MLHCSEDNPPIPVMGEHVNPIRRSLNPNIEPRSPGEPAWVDSQHCGDPDEHCCVLPGGVPPRPGKANGNKI